MALTERVRDAGYVVLGFGVDTWQRTKPQRAAAGDAVADLALNVSNRINPELRDKAGSAVSGAATIGTEAANLVTPMVVDAWARLEPIVDRLAGIPENLSHAVTKNDRTS